MQILLLDLTLIWDIEIGMLVLSLMDHKEMMFIIIQNYIMSFLYSLTEIEVLLF